MPLCFAFDPPQPILGSDPTQHLPFGVCNRESVFGLTNNVTTSNERASFGSSWSFCITPHMSPRSNH
eukprot:m.6465 g.6465  ORF g.6465 m.6465 type:complete len:67 (+) comp3837_c0_seq2:2903-3103(+)